MKKWFITAVVILVCSSVLFVFWYQKRQIPWRLSTAAMNGNLQEVQKLVSKGADINRTPDDGGVSGFPPLLAAAMGGHEDVVRFLLEKGANPEVHVVDTPLLVSIIKKHKAISKVLLEHGANPNVRGEGVPLIWAVDWGDLELARLLLQHGADPEFGAGDNTPLSEAIHEGNSQMAELLRSYGAKK